MAQKKPLTPRQQEILSALEGRTVAEAAKKLKIQPGAVYGHIGRIREAGHKVVLDTRGGNGKGDLPPADLPPLRGSASRAADSPKNRNGKLDGALGRIDKETDAALDQEKSALEQARAHRDDRRARRRVRASARRADQHLAATDGRWTGSALPGGRALP
jgi:hypothetical protein